MDRVYKFLTACKTFYLATTEGNYPRVRPFGAVCRYEGKLYFITNNRKKVYRQLQANPQTEISGTIGGDWLRLHGKAVFDDRREVKAAMLEAYPSLKKMYHPDDGLAAAFYLEGAVADFYSISGEKESITL